MKKLFLCILLLSGLIQAQPRQQFRATIVPDSTGKRALGASDKAWGNIHVDTSIVSPVVTVASSSSLNRTHADYICDGTADQVQIQAAMDALGSRGTVLLLEGIFNASDTIKVPANITIKGSGKNGTIVKQATSNLSLFNFRGDSVTFENLIIAGNCDTTSYATAPIATQWTGIFASGDSATHRKNITIKDCVIKHFAYAIACKYNEIIIKDNVIDSCYIGIYGGADYASRATTQNDTTLSYEITGNKITCTYGVIWLSRPITIPYSLGHVFIQNNTLRGGGMSFESVKDITVQTVTPRTFIDKNDCDMLISGGSTITNNIINRDNVPAGRAIYSDYNVGIEPWENANVQGNVIKRCVNGIVANLVKVNIIGNQFINCGSDTSAGQGGIIRVGSRSLSAYGTKIIGNYFENTQGDIYEILINDADNILVQGNQSLNSHYTWLYVGGQSKQIKILDNSIINCLRGSNGTAATDVCVYEGTSVDSYYNGNTFADTLGDGYGVNWAFNTGGNATFGFNIISGTRSGAVWHAGDDSTRCAGLYYNHNGTIKQYPISSISLTNIKLSALTDTYLPYHVSDASGLANSPLSTDGTYLSLTSTADGNRNFTIQRNTNTVTNYGLLFLSTLSATTSVFGRDGDITFRNANSTNNNYSSIQNLGSNNAVTSGIDFINVDHSYNGAIRFNTRLVSGTYGERMRIDGAGNVGIGVAADSMLTVNLGANIKRGLNVGTNAVIGGTATIGGVLVRQGAFLSDTTKYVLKGDSATYPGYVTLTNHNTKAATNQTMYIGTTSHAINRASAEEALTGITDISGSGLNLPHAVNKAASANVRNSHDAEATSTSGTYAKAKTMVINKGLVGQARFLFDIHTELGIGETAYGRIYRNGVALGSEQTTTGNTYTTKSQDITQTWNPGDTCELYIKNNGGGLNTYVRNFRIAYDDSPTITVSTTNTTP
jgi:hypothetical protein